MDSTKKSYLIKQYTEIHRILPTYGSTDWLAPFIKTLCSHYRLKNVLDFGCGKGALVQRLLREGVIAEGYDPAVAPYQKLPSDKFDLVMANDVLEHLDPDNYLVDLKTIAYCTRNVIFTRISCRKAYHHLPDGQNCHTLILPPGRWKKLLCKCWVDFQLVESQFDWWNKNLTLIFVHKSQATFNHRLLRTIKVSLTKRLVSAVRSLKLRSLSGR